MAETETETQSMLKVSPQVLAKLKAMKAQIEHMQQNLQAYMGGLADAMGLVGNYEIDENTGVISPVLPPESPQNGGETKS